jgi:adenylosuccinate synthase
MAKKKNGCVKAVFGGQFGDEGKGKVVDYLAQNAHIVARFNGGNNAGHSVRNNLGDFKLSSVPVGMVSGVPGQIQIMGPGVVWDPWYLVQELKGLEARGIDISGLRIDDASHVIMPWHISEDCLEESRLGENKIGTTKRGIGPCYADKMRKAGLRAGDLLGSSFAKRFIEIYNFKEKIFQECYGHPYSMPPAKIYLEGDLDDNLSYLASRFGNLDNLICDTPPILWRAIDQGQNIILEGAQGALLDIDHGTYPYVTSSATGVAGASQGSGIAPSDITERIGVIKAYMTRVGNGPFPTRASEYDEKKLREAGQEYGTVTNRPRSCGWFDTVSFKRVARLNGLTSVAITKLDILDDFAIIGIQEQKSRIDHAYGWGHEKRVRGLRDWDLLPERAKDLCRREACGYKINLVSTGPSRDETIKVRRKK